MAESSWSYSSGYFQAHLSLVVAFHNYSILRRFDGVGIALKSGWLWSGDSVSSIIIIVRKGCGVWTGNDRAACFDLLRAILKRSWICA